jgi:hypothetical protein
VHVPSSFRSTMPLRHVQDAPIHWGGHQRARRAVGDLEVVRRNDPDRRREGPSIPEQRILDAERGARWFLISPSGHRCPRAHVVDADLVACLRGIERNGHDEQLRLARSAASHHRLLDARGRIWAGRRHVELEAVGARVPRQRRNRAGHVQRHVDLAARIELGQPSPPGPVRHDAAVARVVAAHRGRIVRRRGARGFAPAGLPGVGERPHVRGDIAERIGRGRRGVARRQRVLRRSAAFHAQRRAGAPRPPPRSNACFAWGAPSTRRLLLGRPRRRWAMRTPPRRSTADFGAWDRHGAAATARRRAREPRPVA